MIDFLDLKISIYYAENVSLQTLKRNAISLAVQNRRHYGLFTNRSRWRRLLDRGGGMESRQMIKCFINFNIHEDGICNLEYMSPRIRTFRKCTELLVAS